MNEVLFLLFCLSVLSCREAQLSNPPGTRQTEAGPSYCIAISTHNSGVYSSKKDGENHTPSSSGRETEPWALSWVTASGSESFVQFLEGKSHWNRVEVKMHYINSWHQIFFFKGENCLSFFFFFLKKYLSEFHGVEGRSLGTRMVQGLCHQQK